MSVEGFLNNQEEKEAVSDDEELIELYNLPISAGPVIIGANETSKSLEIHALLQEKEDCLKPLDQYNSLKTNDNWHLANIT